MDDAGGQVPRPVRLEPVELGAEFGGEARLNRVGAFGAGLEQRSPARDRQVVGPRHGKGLAGDMHARHGFPQQAAMPRRNPPRPHALEEADDGHRAPAQLPERIAVAAVDRRRAGGALGRQMIHQAQEKRQVVRGHALFIEGEYVGVAVGLEEVVGVLDPFGDSLVGDQLADVVFGKERPELVVRNFGVDSHESYFARNLKASATVTRRRTRRRGQTPGSARRLRRRVGAGKRPVFRRSAPGAG